MKRLLLTSIFIVAVLVMSSSLLFASTTPLTPGATYTISVYTMNHNGTVSTTPSVTVTGTANSNGKLTFTLSGLPTYPDTNFMILTISDANGNIVRYGFAPASPSGATLPVGVNDLSTTQGNAIISAAGIVGSDDPIPLAYLVTILRSSIATAADISDLAHLGAAAITGAGTGGFEDFLLSTAGVTAAQLAAFKGYLVYNSTTGSMTIANLVAGFKDAVDSGNTTTANDLMQKAGGDMAEVFMDAANAAGIDLSLILAAHNAAGNIANASTYKADMASNDPNFSYSMNQSMDSFFERMDAVKIAKEYTNALTTLGASGSQVTAFNSAVQTLLTTNQSIDTQYAAFFSNPDTYLTQNYGAVSPANFNTVQQAINAAYQNAFSTFQTGIVDTNYDVCAMQANVLADFGAVELGGTTTNFLPSTGPTPINCSSYNSSTTGNQVTEGSHGWSSFGTYYGFGNPPTPENWPIPQLVAVNWLATNIVVTSGASTAFTYTRDTTPVPAAMNWMTECLVGGSVTNPISSTDVTYGSTPCNAQTVSKGWKWAQTRVSSGYGVCWIPGVTGPLCVANGGTLVIDRHPGFGNGQVINNLMRLQEDVQIQEFIENTSEMGCTTNTCNQSAQMTFATAMSSIANSINGYTNGNTSSLITSAQKSAIVQLCQQPQMD